MSMNYAHRMLLAALLSLLLHVVGIGVLQYTYEATPPLPPPVPEPLVINLQPEPPPAPAPAPTPPRQIIDVAEPAPEPPPPTDRIAETNARSMDLAALSREDAGPQLELDDFDALPQMTAPAAPPEPPPPPPAEQQTPPLEEEAPESEDGEEPEVAEMLLDEMDIPLESIGDPDTVTERPEPPTEDRIRIARTMPAPPQRPSPGRTRNRAGVSNKGNTNFSAIQNEIAPYLKHIRDRVEARWNEMLYTRYSGTSPVKAVIDCAINARGELVSVTVVEPVDDRLYSALCRDAVMRAGPFGAFTFEVPDIYKDKNLEIRWTFNFM